MAGILSGMNVHVRSVGLIKMLLGDPEFDVAVAEGTTVMGLLRQLHHEAGDKFAPFAVEPKDPDGHAPLRVLVNGRDIAALDGIRTVLHDGDDVLMFLPIAGG